MNSNIQVELVLRVFQGKSKIDQYNVNFDLRYWTSLIEKWLLIIKNTTEIDCPALVRNVDKFSLGIHFTDDKTIKKINYNWRNKDTSTDVLSFSALGDGNIYIPSQPLELGDIIVSLQTAFKQAKENNQDLKKELKWLVSHGLLHLLGWEHETSNDLKKMLDLQDNLIF